MSNIEKKADATWALRLSELEIGDEEIQSVVDVLESDWLTMGPRTEAFEVAFAQFLNVKHAIAVTNATAALHLAHHVHDIGPGDEVICPSLTFIATANSILYTGATPVFAEITSEKDFNLDPNDVERRITSRTKGIVVLHYAGYCAAMDRIKEIADRHGLYLIEDAAHAPGSELGGRKLGTIGDVGCFSFFSNKNMSTGEGGLVVTNSDQLADRIRRARSHSMTSFTWDRVRGHAHSYDVVDLGFNYRIDEIRSAIGFTQLGRLSKNNDRRKALMEKYLTELRQIDKIAVPFDPADGISACHICPLLLAQEIDRAAFMNGMKERGIQTSIHYPPVHLFSYYRDRFGFQEGMLPLTEMVTRREVTLPLYPGMHDEDVIRVVGALVDTLATTPSNGGVNGT
ncbi:MAG: DegT/DnrJ/EryC1/StrS aminotransferase family protein [Candidatus Latescibacteria bacterium]|jgi:dTDP-4-amino-4,6-dideoxygalactose transaminase|nr:DegT/DnrJ/EryC1/StrS aminotransferase family protein [Candidatus Latescibacterota bacterium]